jgi:WD40 repeat protein
VIEWDPTSKLTLAAGASGAVVVIDAALGMQVTKLEGQGIVRTAHFDPSSRRIVSASMDGSARVFDTTSPYRRWSSSPIGDDCGIMTSLEPDRRFVAIGCGDHATRVWDTAHDQLLAELPSVTPVPGDFAGAFPAVSADGTRAAIARGNAVEVYGLPGRHFLHTIAHRAPVNAVAFAQTGHALISGAIDGTLLVTRDGRDPIALPTSGAGIDAAAFLADGRIVAADDRGRLRVYDLERGTTLADLETPTRIGLLRPSPDSRYLVTVPGSTIPSSNGKAGPPVLWDVEHYRVVTQLDGHAGRVFSARWVAGQILTAGSDGAARLWDGETGRLLRTYRGESALLVDATVSPDGSVVAGGSDGVLWFWDAGGRPLWTLPTHTSRVIGIHFEGEDLVTRGFAGDVSRWSLPSPERVIEAVLTK